MTEPSDATGPGAENEPPTPAGTEHVTDAATSARPGDAAAPQRSEPAEDNPSSAGAGERPDNPATPHPGAASPSAPPGGPPARSPGPSARGQREAFEAARQLRELREELDRVRTDVATVLGNRESDRAQLREANGWISELLPRVDDLETRLRELAEQVTPAPEDTDTDTPDRPTPTPAIGWDDMDHGTARDAWEALARFVGDVLHGRYRLTRLQIPDCWPLHPRLIREIAWLRSSYLDAGALEPALPPAAAPWHTRALPPFLANMVDAVDARECRPGIHRLTEHEVDNHLNAVYAARERGDLAPPPSTETGVDRPRFTPEAFPTRGTAPPRGATSRSGGSLNPPKVNTLPDLITGSCEPRWWLGHYHEASAADLAQRPATVTPPAPTAPGPAAGSPTAPEGGTPPDGDTTDPAADPARSTPDDRPQRFDLDSSSDDLADGGPNNPGGPGGLGGLDGPAGPL